MRETYEKIHRKIEESKKIALISHKFPDGDTLGSVTAMYEMIMTNFDNKIVDIINMDGVAEKLAFLPHSDKVNNRFIQSNYELCIFLDVGNIGLAGYGEKKDFNTFIVNIDHHESNICYGDINLVEYNKPSTTTVLFDFFDGMEYKMNKDIATSLLTGIYTDTGSFIYSNVQPSTFEIASKLIDLGGNIDLIASNFFLNNTFEFIKLFGIALKRLKINREGMAFSYLKKEDILGSGCKYEEMDGVVWRLNMLDNAKYVCFLYEKGGLVKGSLRTSRDDVDLTIYAKKYNGGGHRKACGFTLEGHIEISENSKVDVRQLDNSIINIF